MVSIGDLIVFIEAAACNNYSQTAKKLGYSQPTITQKIKRLENQFGVELFQRHGHSMQLTEAGRTLEPLSKEFISLTCLIEEKMAAIQDQVIGEMTIGCSMTLGKYLLTGLIAAFRNQYPFAQVNIECLKKQKLVDQLSAGEVAFGLANKITGRQDIECKKLLTDEIILVVPVHHVWVENAPIYPHDLLSEPMIMLEEPGGTRELIFDALKKQDINPGTLNVALEFDNAEAIVMAVEEGVGIAFLSRLSAQRSLKLGKIAEVQIEGLDLKREIFMVRNKALVSKRVEACFWDFIGSQKEFEHLSSMSGLSCSVQEC